MKNETKTAEILYQEFLNLSDNEKINFLSIISENLNKLKNLADLEFKNLLSELKSKTKSIKS